MQKIICFVGPSGVGKTALSVEMAKQFDAEIISADSMQIYREMNIGTAKINEDEKQNIPHHLIDILNPDENFSVALWCDMAKKRIEEIASRGKNVFIVGGTGLYVKSLIFGYDFFTGKREENNFYENYLENNGSNALWQLLNEKDPVLAKKTPENKTRAIIRYLQIIDSGNKVVEKDITPQYDYLLLGLSAEREELYKRTDKRVDLMFDNDLTSEAKHIIEKYNLSPESQSALAIGYREFFDYFAGNQTLDRTKELIKQHSRNYVKRQLTFFSKMKNINWVSRENKKQIKDMIKIFLEK